MDCDCEPHQGRNYVNEAMQSFSFSGSFLGIERVSVLKFYNVTMLTTNSPLENDKIRL